MKGGDRFYFSLSDHQVLIFVTPIKDVKTHILISFSSKPIQMKLDW